MTAPTIGERLRLAGLRASAALRRLRRQAAAPWICIADLAARAPGKLLIAPQDIRTADPTIANDIYSGYFAFGSKIVDVHGASPFATVGPSVEWERELMAFRWLRHLRAADTPLAKANARALIEEWLAHCGRPSSAIAWQPDVAACRLMAWLCHSPLILEGADLAFYRRFMKAIGRHVVWLRREGARARGATRLISAIALAQAALCSDVSDSQQKKASRQLAQALNKQILVDGGHIGRNPQTLISILLDLLPLRQAYVARNVAAPPEINNAIDRIMPMLRLFRHPDGAIALFNGMGLTAQDELATVLAYDDARAQPILNAISAGYQRLEAGESVVICDAGSPPPMEFSSQAHAGALSFEMSSGGERMIVNCGAPVAQNGALRQAARSSAAHSTLALDDTSSCSFAGLTGADTWLEGCIISGPEKTPVDRSEDADAVGIHVSHDGYASRFGLIHERHLRLSSDGLRLEGMDRLQPAERRGGAAAHQFTIRFHLHPNVKAGSVENGQGVLLVTPAGQQWIFHASGVPVSIEESAFFASPEGVRATTQLVIGGEAAAGATVEWVLLRKG